MLDEVNARHARGAGGDLRPGRRRSSPSTPKTRPCASPTTASTASPARSGPATLAARCARRERVRTGTLSINTNNAIHVEAPFGGYKQSGIGRELGMYGIELYTEVKNVYIDL